MADQRGPLQSDRIHEAQDELLAIGAAYVLRWIGLAKAGQVERDGANTLSSQGRDVATEHICRGAERTAVQQDGRHAAAFFEGAFFEIEIARVEAVDCYEAVTGFEGDIHWRELLRKTNVRR